MRPRRQTKGLYIFGQGPRAHSDPDTGHALHARQSLEFLAAQDLFSTETARLADVALPGRCYAEKEGTFTNTERRVQRVRRAVEGPAGSRLDTAVFAELMRRMGHPQPDLSAEQIMQEIRPAHPLLRRARATGGSTARRWAAAGVQWPCPSPEHPGTPTLHAGGAARGLGRLLCPHLGAPRPSSPTPIYPLVLMTGRVLAQYNACAMTGRTPGLKPRRPVRRSSSSTTATVPSSGRPTATACR